MKLEITSISIFKTWKILMIIYAIPFALFVIAGAVRQILFQSESPFSSFAITAPLISLALSSLFILCACLIYNLLAKLFGGIEFTVEEHRE